MKNVEKELIQAKKLVEQSLRLKESFLTNMSHEIRTPMNAILGFTELLAKKDLGPQQNEYVKTIRSSGDNLLRLLNDILDFSKLEANMLVFEEQPISVNDIIISICDLLAPKATGKGISLRHECDPAVPKVVVGDSVRLNQVITNIVGNAIKFTEKGGVVISSKYTGMKGDKVQVEFMVKDSGIGIAPDKLAAIFNRFEQADSDTSRFYGGTGLGLSIAKHLIESQQGSIEVASELGAGATFSFVIPFKLYNEPEGRLNVEKKQVAIDYDFMRSVKVLMVEDNLFNRKLMQGIFAEYDLTLDMSENGKVALERLHDAVYDVILMDIEMPEMNGYDTSRIIRDELKLSTPIIALTAHAMAGEKEKCLQAGMNDYLTKPVNVTLLFEKLYNIVHANAGDRVPEKKEVAVEEAPAINNVQQPPVANGTIDLSYLKEISSGNKEFEKEMIGLLLMEVPEQVTQLQEAFANRDFPAIKVYTHKLKSLVPILGAPETIPFLNSMEKDAIADKIDDENAAAFDGKIAYINKCLDALNRLLLEEYA
ncbi:chemotaxis protein CheY [Niabella soli DSM 19437]|uniref:histidine kinase n=1 Tax=Niabella soli DSM 19437 TaxID=929713 RepID=W0EY67_9BACT|nr:chemotaxis protein CheY [Niabella soli DSM 19437]